LAPRIAPADPLGNRKHPLTWDATWPEPVTLGLPVVVDRLLLQVDVAPGTALMVRAWTEAPPAGIGDGDVIDAGLAAAHQAAVVELPQLVPVAAEPLPGRIVPLVLEAYGHPVVTPQTRAQYVVQLGLPLSGQELDDLLAAGDELVAVTPDGGDLLLNLKRCFRP
jgi:hypothetical protein